MLLAILVSATVSATLAGIAAGVMVGAIDRRMKDPEWIEHGDDPDYWGW